MELSELQCAVLQQNKINELEEDLCNIQLLIDNPLCKIRERDNEPVCCIMESIFKMQKELKELREFKDNTTGHTVKE